MKKDKRRIIFGFASILLGIITLLTYPMFTFIIAILLVIVGHIVLLSSKGFSNQKMIIGVSLLLAGIICYVFNFGPIFRLLSYPFAICGLAISLFSGSSIKTKIIGIVLPLTIALLFIQIRKGEDEIFLIPDGYRGPVRVHFEELNGENIDFEDGKRIYQIPETGVLFTNIELTKHNKREFYWVKPNGDRKQINMNYTHENDSIKIVPGWYGNSSGKHIYFFIGTIPESLNLAEHDFKKEEIEKLKNELQQ